MNESDKKNSYLAKAGEDLFNYAIDREDVRWLVDNIPEECKAVKSEIEYELQILKIIGVGWNLSFFLENLRSKESLSEVYWGLVHRFACELSANAGILAEKEIDYFEILKNRLNMYIEALNADSSVKDPVKAIGPAFAKRCKAPNDLFVFMAGAKMFSSLCQNTRKYLVESKLI